MPHARTPGSCPQGGAAPSVQVLIWSARPGWKSHQASMLNEDTVDTEGEDGVLLPMAVPWPMIFSLLTLCTLTGNKTHNKQKLRLISFRGREVLGK